MTRRTKMHPSLLISTALLLAAPLMLHCGKGDDAAPVDPAAVEARELDDLERTRWENDIDVLRERYRRLGLNWDTEHARTELRCIIRSAVVPRVILVGAPDPAFAALGPEAPCAFDSVMIGAKTYIVGIGKATDRVMITGGWKHLEEPDRQRLLLAWFHEGLTAGVHVITTAEQHVVTGAKKAWSPPAVTHEGDRYTVAGWVRVGSVTAADHYELRRCTLTADLNFEGCDPADSFGAN